MALLKIDLFRELEAQGCKGTAVSVHRLYDLGEEIEGRYREGFLDEEFYQERLAVFTFSPPDALPDVRSLIVVAVPEPQLRVIFTWNDRPVPVIVPPTFYPEQQVAERVRDLLAEVLNPAAYRVAQAVLPKKLLAVYSGLGVYGRNNLCYVSGMGSFHRLVAFCSDLPCPEDDWRGLKMMERCEKCAACLRHCPTGAIAADRFLLHAERCLTFHNERMSDVAFPAWIDRAWHDCLVGCMRCQSVCPQNGDFLGWVEDGPSFSEGETALLLEGLPHDHLPQGLANKLEQFGMMAVLEVLPRNLRHLLEGMEA